MSKDCFLKFSVVKKLILFELNEVPVKILEFYARLKPQSTIAQILKSSKRFESYTENKGHLSPWNTWPTLHRGVSNEQHLIQDFGQNLKEVDQEFPAIWSILAKEGRKIGVFGSLHSYPLPSNLENYNFFIPDVFASSPECHPKSVEIFQEFNLTLSRESVRNVSKKTPILEGMKLMANINKLGFTFETIKDTVSQVIEEKVSPWKTVRRRTYQSVLSFDVFMKQLQDNKPDFVTFFTNHLASSMHRFWAATFPEEYNELPFDTEWLSTYNKEIVFAMDATDGMLERLLLFINKFKEYKLIIASSMGQDAIKPKAVNTSLFVKDTNKFLQQLGLSPSDYVVKPAMFPQFNVELKSSFDHFEENLQQLNVQGNQVHFRRNGNVYSIDLGHELDSETYIDYHGSKFNIEDLGLENVLIEDKCGSTAYHIPEGIFLIYHPSFRLKENGEKKYTKMSTSEIAPQILKNFGLKPMPYMTNSNAPVEFVFGE